MTSPAQCSEARDRAAAMFARAGLVLGSREQINVVDFGLGDLDQIGLEVVTHIDTDRYCVKEIAALPRQTCPQHLHPPVNGEPGKEETFHCRWGSMWLYVEGEPTPEPHARLPRGSAEYFTAFHEIPLGPGDQYTVKPNTLHWLQAGDEGAVFMEFCSASRDAYDVFTDPRVRRDPPTSTEA